jgi:hypothetical protein
VKYFRFQTKPPWWENIQLHGLIQKLLSGKYKYYVNFTRNILFTDINIKNCQMMWVLIRLRNVTIVG